MLNTNHLLKVTVAWISIAYIICFVGVALFPGIRSGFMLWALHSELDLGTNVATWGTFFSGLLIWNVIALFFVWLFIALFNGMKR